ncbi:MAG: hypothetical protein JNK04_09810 [Myxococcales bacterium]|nr:hypothetical protein [Myxococcales bacterium]
MLRIRPEQMEHFANRARDRFTNLMTEYIWDTFPDRAPEKNRAALASWVRRAVAVCERYEVVMEPAAAQLILLLLVLGIDRAEASLAIDAKTPTGTAEGDAWIREALARKVAPAGKVRRLIAACHERSLPISDLIVVDEYRAPVEET